MSQDVETRTGEVPGLLPQHQELIEASGISPEAAAARGYRSVTSKAELAEIGFNKHQRLVPGLLVPIYDVNGKLVTHQYRPDAPRLGKIGKPTKYETPPGSHLVLDVPPAVLAALGDPKIDLWITEGARKADSAVSHGLPCIALMGVWAWRGSNGNGGKMALACWESIALNGRHVRVVFDSDVTTKPEVAKALSRFTAFLESRGAKVVTIVYLPPGEGGAKVGLDDYLATHSAEELRALAPASATTRQGPVAPGPATPKPPSQSKVLVDLASSADLFCSPDGETAYATVTVNGHQETWAAKSTGFRRYLARCFHEQEGKPPTSQAMQEALGVIEATAYYGGAPRRPVYTRLAEHGGDLYVDLANDQWQVVKITAEGWQVVDQCPVRFRRPKAMLPLPTPVSGSSLEELFSFINVEDKATRKLLVGWLVGTLNSVGSYPVLVLGGEHGSGKSTASAVLRKTADPNASLLRAEPRNTENLIIAANNSWIVNLDNTACLQSWLSDSICRISTGGGLSKRELYTDDGETILNVKRPVILNGIEEIVTRPDLLDRSILATLPTIPEEKRIPEREFWAAFDAAHPRILGALLDAVSMALKRLGDIHLDRLPRMADFALWVTAAEPALGWEAGAFVAAYAGNRSEAHELALDASPLAAAVREFLAKQPGEKWDGTATALLEALNALATTTDQIRKSDGWPKAPYALTGKLRALAPNLRAVGVEVVLPGRSHKKRLLSLYTLSDGKKRPERPERPTNQENAELGGGAPGGAPAPGGALGGAGGAPAPEAPPCNSAEENERGAGGAGGAEKPLLEDGVPSWVTDSEGELESGNL